MTTPTKTSNPLFTIAAIAVTLFSGVGIATMMGWIPNSHSKVADANALTGVSGTSGAAHAVTAASLASASPPAMAANAPLTTEPAPGSAPAGPASASGSGGSETPPMLHHRKPARVPVAAYGVPPPGSAPAGNALADNAVQGVPPPGTGTAAEPINVPTCSACGTVHSVFLVETKGSGTGLGAVAGGVLGAVVGHQVGSGNGNTLATLLGAGGGALAGNTVEQNVKKTSSWKVTVDMSDGSQRTFTFHDRPGYASGDRVRIDNGQLVSN